MTYPPTRGPEHQSTPNGILNLSSYILDHNEVDILLKGLTFVPKPLHIDSEDLQQGITDFIRSLKFHHWYGHNSTNTRTPKFKIPSNFIPHKGSYPPEIDELEIKLKQKCRKLPQTNKDPNNVSRIQNLALQSLSSNPNIIIKPADKGSAIVIQDRSDYTAEANRQLANPNHYREIPEPIFPNTCQQYNAILAEMKAKNLISYKLLQYLTADPTSRERIFYLLPKIHKAPEKWTIPSRIPPGRPIVSDVQSESYHISKFIDYHLAPFATTHSSYVKNTYDFLDKMGRCQVDNDAFLVSLDVDSLYTNIDNSMGLEAVKQAFQKDPQPIHPYILQLLQMSLENNDFSFNGHHYLQVSGTAMGKKFAPHYADITMAYWETIACNQLEEAPAIYLRYLDDIFLVWEHDLETFDKVFDKWNKISPNIQLKKNIQEQELEFLDVLVYKGPQFHQTGRFDTKVYFKPTDSHALLHRDSYHPGHTFPGLIKSQLIRYARICNNQPDFEEATNILFKAVEARGYKRRTLRKIRTHITHTYYPAKGPGLHPCNSRRCHICPYVKTLTVITDTIDYFRVMQTGDCNSNNCIYLIGCDQCPQALYVGQTKSLRQRFTNHISTISRNKSQTKLVQHFNLPDHNLGNIFLALLENLGPAKNAASKLDKLEGDWISKLESIDYGLNEIKAKDKNPESVIPFIAKFSPSARTLTAYAREQADNMGLLNNATFIGASRANKNLSRLLVRANITPHPDMA